MNPKGLKTSYIQKQRLGKAGLPAGALVVLARGESGLPIRREEMGRGPLKGEVMESLHRLSQQILASLRWTSEEITALAHIAVALRLIRPETYRICLNGLRDRLEKALFQNAKSAPLPDLAMAVDHLASPDPRVERLLAIANLDKGVSVDILDRYPLSDEIQVNLIPESVDLAGRRQLETEFRGKRVLVVDPHSDDAPFYMGSLLDNVITKVAQEALLVTMALDPMGVTDEFASKALRRMGRPFPKDRKGWLKVKEEIRAKEAQEIASAIGLKSAILRDPVNLLDGCYDSKGKLLPYYSTFTPPTVSTLRKFSTILHRFRANAVLLPLASGHYHQTHRDAARLTLLALYKEHLAQPSRGPTAIYFYSDSPVNLFGLYGLRSNITYFYGEREEEKKLAFLSLVPSQIDRNPYYHEQVKAKDLMIAVMERARHCRQETGHQPSDLLYAEHLLKVAMVPKWSATGRVEGEPSVPEEVAQKIRLAMSPLLGEQFLLEITPYDPFHLLPGRYFLAKEEGIVSDEYLVRMGPAGVDALWKLPPSRIKPGHGLFIAEHLNVKKGDSLADLGTGPLGFLALLGAYRGASEVFAIDINPSFLKTAREGAAFSGLDQTVRVIRGDLFESLDAERFTYVVFHPPMLPAAPSASEQRIPNYDEGGPTGREILDRAIAQTSSRLSSGGALLIGQFEFLGVDRAFGEPPSTFEVFKRHGFKPRIVAAYEIPVTPIVRDRAGLIQEVYPRYRFVLRNGKLWHKFVIVGGHFTPSGRQKRRGSNGR